MSFTEEAVKAKLSSLNESQDSIVTVAQWIMFHRRHADKTANIWLQRIKDSNPDKRLNLLYLANEVTQQSRAKRRDEFLHAFSPVVVEATIVSYKGAPPHVQSKIARVVQVWRERQLFDPKIQQAMELQIAEIDKSRPQTHRKPLGGSLSASDGSSHVPVEFQPLVQSQHTLSRAHLSIKPALQAADKDYNALTSGPLPTPPVYASRLSALGKALATAEAAVSETLKTRKSLIDGLEKLLEANREALKTEESQSSEVSIRRAEIDAKKATVEDAIMRGLPATEDDSSLSIPGENESNTASGGAALNSSAAATHHESANIADIERPDIERFTPPLAPSPSAEPTAAAAPPERSTTPDGLPPTYQSGNAGTWFQGDGTRTPPEVPFDEDAQGWAPLPMETLTPPAARIEPRFNPVSPVVAAYVAAASRDPRKRPASGMATLPGLGAERSEVEGGLGNGTLNGNGDGFADGHVGMIAGLKRRKTSQDDYDFGGGDALEGLDAEVVGMLG